MKIQIYRGTGRVFAFVAVGHETPLPQRHGPWASFKIVDLVAGQPQPGVDVGDCLEDIARHGIHVTDAHARITQEAIG